MKRTLPFLAALFFFYLLFYEIVQVIPMKELLRKGLMIQNIFVYSPLTTVLVQLSIRVCTVFLIVSCF